MKSFYKILSIATSVLFVYLFSLLFFRSDSFVTDLGIEPSIASLVLARRAAMFMIGISVLLLVSFLGLSCMGTYELINGNVNSSIIVAIVIETILWVSYGFVIIKDRKAIL